MTVLQFKPPLYEAKLFKAQTQFGEFKSAGTLCGHLDFCGPFKGTYTLSTDEALAITVMLQRARADVLENSDPNGDPRLYDPS